MAGGSDVAEPASLSCASCGKPAHLQCPKCVQLKLPREAAAFCTQECFKASWNSHKPVHLKAKSSESGTDTPDNEGWLYCLKKGQTRTAKLPYFDWTGALRPYPISSKRIVPAHIDLPDWAAGVIVTSGILPTSSLPPRPDLLQLTHTSPSLHPWSFSGNGVHREDISNLAANGGVSMNITHSNSKPLALFS